MLGRARLKHLQLIVQISELQSLQKAASVIGLSQPAATHALAEFEAMLGTALFERHARGMRPTPAAMALLPMVRSMLRLMQACAETVTSLQDGASGLVRIGAIGAAVSGWLTQALPAFSAANPDVVVEVHEMPVDELLPMLEAKRIDLALCRELPTLPAGMAFQPALSDRKVVACRTGHPLSKQASVSNEDLARFPWLITPLSGNAAHEFDLLRKRLREDVRIFHVASRSALLTKAMLDSADLLALLPYNFIRPLVNDRALALVATPPLDMAPLGLLTSREYQPAPAISRVIECLQTWADV